MTTKDIVLFPRTIGKVEKSPSGQDQKQLYKLSDDGLKLVPDRIIDWQAYIDSFSSEVDYNALIKAHRGDLSVFANNGSVNLGDVSRIQGVVDSPSKVAELLVTGGSRIQSLREKYTQKKEESKNVEKAPQEMV